MPFYNFSPGVTKCFANASGLSGATIHGPKYSVGFLLRTSFTRRPRAPVLTKQNGAHLRRQMARELDWRGDRFRRRSFVSSWHLWESSRRRHVQVGIREGLGTTEAGLMEHKMGSCGDVFWSAATVLLSPTHICTARSGKRQQLRRFVLRYWNQESIIYFSFVAFK